MTEAIIFDKDGTLFDFLGTWSSWADIVLDEISGGDSELRGRAARAIKFESGRGFDPSSVVIAQTSRDVSAVLAEATGQSVDMIEELSNRIASGTPQQGVPGLSETLSVLAGSHVLGLVTNDGEAPARAHLGAAGIADFFAFVAGYDSGHGAKPAPGPLLAFSRMTGTRPERTLMVGDSRHDLSAGRAAGMRTIGVLTGIATAGDLSDLADAVLPDISHLPDWISLNG